MPAAAPRPAPRRQGKHAAARARWIAAGAAGAATVGLIGGFALTQPADTSTTTGAGSPDAGQVTTTPSTVRSGTASGSTSGSGSSATSTAPTQRATPSTTTPRATTPSTVARRPQTRSHGS